MMMMKKEIGGAKTRSDFVAPGKKGGRVRKDEKNGRWNNTFWEKWSEVGIKREGAKEGVGEREKDGEREVFLFYFYYNYN
jgi:hypothetical protein